MDRPILRINGTRYTMGKLKAGTYRQVILLGEDYKNYSQDELVEDCRAIIRDAFNLSQEQSDQVDIAAVMPTYQKIKAIAEELFVAEAKNVPNESSPETEPGQS